MTGQLVAQPGPDVRFFLLWPHSNWQPEGTFWQKPEEPTELVRQQSQCGESNPANLRGFRTFM